MARIILNPMIKQIRGKMGNVVFRVGPTGKQTMIKLAGMSRVKWSKAQKEHRQRFKQAVAYAKVAMVDPDVRKVYQKMAAKKHKRPFDMAVSDYFKGNDLFAKK